jgi:signal transduction histidine kinase
VIAAIVFWGYSLQKQSNVVYGLETQNLELQQKIAKSNNYLLDLQKIEDKKNRRTKQYWGEGSTFLLIILLTAAIVYYAYYRQRQLSKLQQNFMLSITHELKTPIAGIKLNLQTLEKRKLDEALQLKLVKSSVQETNRLNDLCENILVATQLENKKKAIYTEMVNMNELLLLQINEMKSRYPQRQFVETIDKEILSIKGDSTLWQLVISNLIENARKYSQVNDCIEISLQKINSTFHLQVKDQGIGISDEEKKHIFEKFYRIGNENTRTSKGTGLGLYIVKKIISLYKYDITVKNNSPQGSIFEVVFNA